MSHYFKNSPLDEVMTRAIKKYMEERKRDPETGYKSMKETQAEIAEGRKYGK